MCAGWRSIPGECLDRVVLRCRGPQIESSSARMGPLSSKNSERLKGGRAGPPHPPTHHAVAPLYWVRRGTAQPDSCGMQSPPLGDLAKSHIAAWVSSHPSSCFLPLLSQVWDLHWVYGSSPGRRKWMRFGDWLTHHLVGKKDGYICAIYKVCIIYVMSSNHYSSLVSVPLYSWGNWDSEYLNGFPRSQRLINIIAEANVPPSNSKHNTLSTHVMIFKCLCKHF